MGVRSQNVTSNSLVVDAMRATGGAPADQLKEIANASI